MIVDLHSHYPMHLAAIPDDSNTPIENVHAIILQLVSLALNYSTPISGPAVTVESLRKGDVGVALSVLYCPFDEMDLGKPYGAPPSTSYFRDLLELLDTVEEHITTKHQNEAIIAHSPAEMDAAIKEGKLALVHAVEGGFHMGSTVAEVRTNVEKLAKRGVAYITVAHLFWRQVATNNPAIPFLADSIYDFVFPQPPDTGLTDLGVAMVEAMIDNHVLIDITHMSNKSMDQTFEILNRRDSSIPVIVSHMACRLGSLRYNLTTNYIQKVVERKGVLGVIMGDHYIRDGLLNHRTRTFAESIEVIRAHIDQIHSIKGCHDYAAIGSDLDGFIKPTLYGLDNASKLRDLEHALSVLYGSANAEKICSGNVLNVLRRYWRGNGA